MSVVLLSAVYLHLTFFSFKLNFFWQTEGFSTIRNLIVIRICRAYFLITPDQYHLPFTFPDGLPADTGFTLKELIAAFVEFFGCTGTYAAGCFTT